MLAVVVIRGDFGVVGHVQRFGAFVFAGRVRVGQGFLGEAGGAGGLVVVVAAIDFFLGGVEGVLGFVAAGPVDGVHGHAFVFVAAVGFHRWHRGAGGAGLDVAAFSHDAGGDDGKRGDQEQQSGFHRQFLSNGAASDR